MFSKLINDNVISDSDFEKIFTEINKYNEKKNKILFTSENINTSFFAKPKDKYTFAGSDKPEEILPT